jgi:hypothetical protein
LHELAIHCNQVMLQATALGHLGTGIQERRGLSEGLHPLSLTKLNPTHPIKNNPKFARGGIHIGRTRRVTDLYPTNDNRVPIS